MKPKPIVPLTVAQVKWLLSDRAECCSTPCPECTDLFESVLTAAHHLYVDEGWSVGRIHRWLADEARATNRKSAKGTK